MVTCGNVIKTFLQHIFVSWAHSLCHQQMFLKQTSQSVARTDWNWPIADIKYNHKLASVGWAFASHPRTRLQHVSGRRLMSHYDHHASCSVVKVRTTCTDTNEKQFLGWRTNASTDPRRTSRVPSPEIFPVAPQAKTTLWRSVFSASPYFKVH